MARASRTELLDRVLDGKPAEVKARVLDLIVRMGIDPEDEFFLIFIALGQLQVLIEDSPNEWQDLFSDFQGELQSWEHSNLRTLNHLAGQVKAMERLADCVNRLIAIMTPLVKNLPELKGNSAQLSRDLENLKESAAMILDARNQAMKEAKLASQLLEDFRYYAVRNEDRIGAALQELMACRNILRNQRPPKSPSLTVNFMTAFAGAMAAILVFQVLILPFFVPL
jgi:hypothetical protein